MNAEKLVEAAIQASDEVVSRFVKRYYMAGESIPQNEVKRATMSAAVRVVVEECAKVADQEMAKLRATSISVVIRALAPADSGEGEEA